VWNKVASTGRLLYATTVTVMLRLPGVVTSRQKKSSWFVWLMMPLPSALKLAPLVDVTVRADAVPKLLPFCCEM
jgi:hypothetical protein